MQRSDKHLDTNESSSPDRVRHELRQTVDELTRYREHLEEMVQERTVELKNANEELQAEIDKRKQAEATLRETEQKLRNIIENSTNLFYMHGTDHVFTYMSPQSRHFFDCEPEEAMGRWTEFITDNPVNRAAIEATQRAIDTGERQPPYMVECIGKMGRKIWVEVNESPILEDGRTVAMVGSLTDITERRRVEEALRESEQRFASFMLHMPAAAWMKDMQGRFVYANAETERVFSTPLTALLGKTDYDFFPPEIARQFDKNDRRVLSEGGSLETTEILRQADGIEHHSLVSKFVVAGPDGKPAYVAGVAFDITERKRMEAELEHFASFPLLNPTPIIEMDSAGKVTFCNSATETILGKAACFDSSNPLIPRDLPDMLRDLHQKKVSHYSRTVEIGDLVFDELIYLAPQFNSVRIYAMDITERRRLEEERSRLAAIVENSDDAIIAKTLSGIIVDWNKGAEKLYGYTASEIKGRHISTLVPAERVDEVPQILERIGRGEIVEHIETIRVTKDGRPIPVSLAISPIKDTSGKIIGASTIAHDITERKRAEQALRESEERLRLAIDSTGLGTFDYYPQTGTMIWSELTKLHFGLPPEARVDYGVFLAGLHPDDRERVDGIIQNLQDPESGGGYNTEYRAIGLQDGRERWIAARGRMFYDETGRAVRFVGTTLDISERKLAQERIDELNTNLAESAAELALANQELEAFNYSVAHDLRNPLNVISSYCQVISELCGDQLDVHCKEYLQEVYNGTMRMNRLIEALLKFSHLAHTELRRETVDLSGMAQEVATELKLSEPGRRVEFRIADGVSADGDAAILRVVLDNLLGNAWKYTGKRDEGIIEFGVTEADGKPAWFVRDNGAGFDMADAEKLFIPFQRLPGVEEFRGFGVGLATVERIIHRHGGRVWAEGEPGKGACFWFTLS